MEFNKFQTDILESFSNSNVVHAHGAPATGKTVAAVELARNYLRDGKKVAFVGSFKKLLERNLATYFDKDDDKPTILTFDTFLRYRDRYALVIADSGISADDKLSLLPYTEKLLILDCDTVPTHHIYNKSTPFYNLEN